MSSKGFLSRPPNFTRNFACFMAYKDSSFLYLAFLSKILLMIMSLTVELNTEICIIANFCFLCTTADEVVNVRIPVLPVDWFTTKLLSRWVAVGEKQLWKRAWEFHVILKTAYFSVLSRTCCYIRWKRKTNFITKNSQNILVKILTPLTRRWI